MADEIPIKITKREKNIAVEARAKLIHEEMSDVITASARSLATGEARNLVTEEASAVATEEASNNRSEKLQSELKRSRRLFIRNLNNMSTDESLKAHFEQWGEVVICNVVRHPVTKESRGYGFVTYKRPHMADDAEAANPHEIDGSVVVVERAMSKELQSELTRSQKLFISNLNNMSTKESLKTHFEQWGGVVISHVVRHPVTKESRGYGFVTYKRTHMADDAEAANPHEIDGSVVVVERAMSKENEEERFLKLFIGNLNRKSTEESLIPYFEQWGEVVSCNVVRDHNTQESRGFGFITYKTAHMVDAVEAAGPHEIDGHVLTTERSIAKTDSAVPSSRSSVPSSRSSVPSSRSSVPSSRSSVPGSRGTMRTLFVANLKNGVEEQDLREFFGKYGAIKAVNIPTDMSTGKNRGYAFLWFDDYGPVENVISSRPHFLQGAMIQVGRFLPNEVKECMKLSQK